MTLGVNIDHIAVLRQARQINDPDVLDALGIVKRAGADQITIHLREDRRHIQDDDAIAIVRHSALPVNIECALASDIIALMCDLRPHRITLVPEKREEVTTEGGLDILTHRDRLSATIRTFKEYDIAVSLFIEPDPQLIPVAKEIGADMVELHTGAYANIFAMRHTNLSRTIFAVPSLMCSRHELDQRLQDEITKITQTAQEARRYGLRVAAGHGLNYHNVSPMITIQEIEELNIGQSIIARAVYTGLFDAVTDMKRLIS